jgi:hypothetical protein
MRGGVTVQRMHSTRIILLWRFLPRHALHPGRWTGGNTIVVRRCIIWYWRRFVRIACSAARLYRLIGAAHGGERIGLPDQARKLRQRVALALCGRMQIIIAAMIVIVRGKRSVLISICHRDDASPSGKLPTRPYKRARPCQMPSQVPM